MSLKPLGVPVRPTSLRDSSSSLSISSWRTRLDGPHLGGAAVVADLEEDGLGTLDQLASVPRRAGVVLDLLVAESSCARAAP